VLVLHCLLLLPQLLLLLAVLALAVKLALLLLLLSPLFNAETQCTHSSLSLCALNMHKHQETGHSQSATEARVLCVHWLRVADVLQLLQQCYTSTIDAVYFTVGGITYKTASLAAERGLSQQWSTAVQRSPTQ
jgi:hypothetical protein